MRRRDTYLDLLIVGELVAEEEHCEGEGGRVRTKVRRRSEVDKIAAVDCQPRSLFPSVNALVIFRLDPQQVTGSLDTRGDSSVVERSVAMSGHVLVLTTRPNFKPRQVARSTRASHYDQIFAIFLHPDVARGQIYLLQKESARLELFEGSYKLPGGGYVGG